MTRNSGRSGPQVPSADESEQTGSDSGETNRRYRVSITLDNMMIATGTRSHRDAFDVERRPPVSRVRYLRPYNCNQLAGRGDRRRVANVADALAAMRRRDRKARSQRRRCRFRAVRLAFGPSTVPRATFRSRSGGGSGRYRRLSGFDYSDGGRRTLSVRVSAPRD